MESPESSNRTRPFLMKRVWFNIPSWIRNKYVISLAAFAVIMLFLDKNDIFTQLQRQKEQKELQASKVYYTNEINELNKIRQSLEQDPRVIEKYAREKYLMKRDNEDLFIISEKHEEANN